ncbi:MAG: hypothetical protein ACLFV2_11965 [Desulfurivibrionaceae bacterium]
MREESVLLENLELANNLSVSMYDLSRKVAGDRWLIKIKCIAATGLPEKFFKKKLEAEDDPGLVEDIKEKFGGNLSFEMSRELNFVDENDKEGATVFLMDSLRKNSIDYMGRKSFVDKLLAKKYEEFRQEILTRRALGLTEQEDDDEDEGPADFSACFRD